MQSPLIYRSKVPGGLAEIIDHLAYMMFSSPNFVDPDFIGRDRETAFSELNESLRRIQKKLGDENFAKLMEMSNRMRVHFEADPNNDNDETIKGRNIILDMEDILKSCMKRRS